MQKKTKPKAKDISKDISDAYLDVHEINIQIKKEARKTNKLKLLEEESKRKSKQD